MCATFFVVYSSFIRRSFAGMRSALVMGTDSTSTANKQNTVPLKLSAWETDKANRNSGRLTEFPRVKIRLRTLV